MPTRKLCFAVAVGFVLFAAMLWLIRPSEPQYHGNSLSEWLRTLDKSPLEYDMLSVQTNHPAAQAFLHMGSNAVPYLVRELRTRDKPWKLKLKTWVRKDSFVGVDLTSAHIRQRRAIQVSYALGPVASAAVPDLVNCLGERRISQILRTFALAATGSEALPAMIDALAHTDSEVRLYTAMAFRYVEFDAEAAIPALIKCLSDAEDYRIQCEAAMALANVTKSPEMVVPALSGNLSHTNEMVRSFAVMALKRVGRKWPAAE